MKLLNIKILIAFVFVAGLVQSARAGTLMLDGMGGKNPGPMQVSIEQIRLQDEPEVLVTFQGAFESRFVAPDGRTYSQLTIPSCGANAKIGYPLMPFKAFFLEIPYGVDVSVKVVDQSVSSLGSGFLIYPKQPSLPDSSMESEPEFVINTAAYAKDAFVPTSPVAIGKPGLIRGRRVVFVRVFPLQYNPVSTELRALSSLRFKLQLEGTPDESGEARKKRLATRTSESLAKDLIKNYKPVELRKSGEIEDKSEELDGRTEFHPLALSEANEADYLIIVDDDLREEILPLAEWKHMKGFITRVVDMSDVGSTASDVEDYIQNAYDTWSPAPSYVLLVGDSGDIPPDYHSGTLLLCIEDKLDV